MNSVQGNASSAEDFAALDMALDALKTNATAWAQTSNAERIAMLNEIKDRTLAVSEGWVEIAVRKKGIPSDSPLAGEEWISGPYAVISACNGLIETLTQMGDKGFLHALPKRTTVTEQLAVTVLPHNLWDRLLLSGVTAEVWMEKGVDEHHLADHTAGAYAAPLSEREGRVALVLGAGNVASIAPLDAMYKLFSEHQVVLLKMNPVNDYLTDYLCAAFRPLIACGALRIVKGGAASGAYLCQHASIDEIHITGAETTHDAIVWGVGEEAVQNRLAATPKINKRVTSELGAVCPTIVVPGPWTQADIRFQAENIATQKLHNSGFNCVAMQMLILPSYWEKKEALMQAVRAVMAAGLPRAAYYPGAAERMQSFVAHSDDATLFDRGEAPACVVVPYQDDGQAWYRSQEIFAPAFSTYEIEGRDAQTYLQAAIDYANTQLHGTLGANILIHPTTIKEMGEQRFQALVADLKYGTVAINTWTGLGFLTTACPWGAFPGHTLADVRSGIGFVHNTFMFDKAERVVVQAPWRPFPRNVLSGVFDLLPKPPWFVTNKTQHITARLMTGFQHKPSWWKLPRIFLNALLG